MSRITSNFVEQDLNLISFAKLKQLLAKKLVCLIKC